MKSKVSAYIVTIAELHSDGLIQPNTNSILCITSFPHLQVIMWKLLCTVTFMPECSQHLEHVCSIASLWSVSITSTFCVCPKQPRQERFPVIRWCCSITLHCDSLPKAIPHPVTALMHNPKDGSQYKVAPRTRVVLARIAIVLMQYISAHRDDTTLEAAKVVVAKVQASLEISVWIAHPLCPHQRTVKGIMLVTNVIHEAVPTAFVSSVEH